MDVRPVDTARLLAADASRRSATGTPGTAMSLAPLACLLFLNVVKPNPEDRAGRNGPTSPVTVITALSRVAHISARNSSAVIRRAPSSRSWPPSLLRLPGGALPGGRTVPCPR
nr:hypothetical protein [Streptomyces sp. MJM1172]